MQEKFIRPILYISGIVTLLAGAQFLAPSFVLRTTGVPVGDVGGVFYAQHWGLMVLVVGALLVYAARHSEVRRPIMLAAGLEKLGFVGMLLTQWSEPALQGLHGAVAFDSACVVLYLIYLFRRSPA